jgi:hypothetical protein
MTAGWFSQTGSALIKQTDRAAAVAYAKRYSHNRDALALKLDRFMMPEITVVISKGQIVKEASNTTARANLDAALAAYNDNPDHHNAAALRRARDEYRKATKV